MRSAFSCLHHVSGFVPTVKTKANDGDSRHIRAWFNVYMWMELLYHVPLSVWAIGALFRGTLLLWQTPESRLLLGDVHERLRKGGDSLAPHIRLTMSPML